MRWTVPATAGGSRIDQVLAELLDEPRARTQTRLDRGEVTVDGVVVRKSFRVQGGEQIFVEPGSTNHAADRFRRASVAEDARDPATVEAAPPPVAVRYEDDDVAVVAKPAGMVVHAGAGVHGGTLVDALIGLGMPLAAAGDAHRPGIVHRLDRGTSGVLVVAKSGAALEGLRLQFNQRLVRRAYWALVDGAPDIARATVDAPIARHPTDRTRFHTAPDGRPAVSHYEVRRRWTRVSAVEVRLETGRTHQVRVHMAALGHPVSGDLAYGASRSLARALDLARPALHAAHLGFAHPVSGAPVTVDEPLPADLARAVQRLDDGIA